MARGGLLGKVLLVAMVSFAAALPNSRLVETFSVAGLKCKLRNVPTNPTRRDYECPDGNPSTVTFCKKGSRTVRIVGNFQAAGLGLCKIWQNPLTLIPAQVVKYDQFADHVILSATNRIPSMFRCVLVEGEKVCVGLAPRAGVSYLTSCVPATC